MSNLIKQQTTTRKISKIESIDGIRGICALAVVLAHSFYLYNAQVKYLPFKLINSLFYSHGIAAVLIFFMLSGLCIHLPVANGKDLKIGTFFIRRSIRILPTLIGVYCLIGFLKTFIKSVDFDSPTWSLWVEILYYSIYPLLYFISSKITTKKLLFVSIFISISTTCLLRFPDTFHSGNNVFENAIMGLAYWVSGMFLAEVLVKKEEIKITRFFLVVDLWILRVLIILLDAVSYVIFHIYGIGYTASFAFISPLLFIYVYREIQETNFNYLLTNIGIFSYSLYLFHQPIMQLTNYIDSEFAAGMSAIIFVVSICVIPYLIFERPSMVIIQKFKERSLRYFR